MPTPENEPSITDLLIQQARVEGKIDVLLSSLTRHDESIDTLYSRTNAHGAKIAAIESSLSALVKTHDSSVSQGLVAVSLMISAIAVLLTLIFNLL